MHASLVAQLVKNLPAMQETWFRSLAWEDSLEQRKATHYSILAWRIPWTVYSRGLQRIGHNWVTFTTGMHTPTLRGFVKMGNRTLAQKVLQAVLLMPYFCLSCSFSIFWNCFLDLAECHIVWIITSQAHSENVTSLLINCSHHKKCIGDTLSLVPRHIKGASAHHLSG